MDAWYHFEDGNPDAQGRVRIRRSLPIIPMPQVQSRVWIWNQCPHPYQYASWRSYTRWTELTEDQEIQFLLPAMEIGDLMAIMLPEMSSMFLMETINGCFWRWCPAVATARECEPVGSLWLIWTRVKCSIPVLKWTAQTHLWGWGRRLDSHWSGQWLVLASSWMGCTCQWWSQWNHCRLSDLRRWWRRLLYLYDWNNVQNHDFGQYYFVNAAEEFFTYRIENVQGLDWWHSVDRNVGNIRMSISTDNENWTVLYDSSTEDQVYTAPAGNIDGFSPNRELRSFDITPCGW